MKDLYIVLEAERGKQERSLRKTFVPLDAFSIIAFK